MSIAEQDQGRAHGARSHDFPIFIDKKQYKVDATSMTGAELRAVPQPSIGQDRDLYRIVPGGDDHRVEDNERIELKPGMRFISVPRQITPGACAQGAR
jgi:hypothetical protein